MVTRGQTAQSCPRKDWRTKLLRFAPKKLRANNEGQRHEPKELEYDEEWRKRETRDERKSKRVREKTNSRHTFQFALLGPDLMPLDAMQTRHMNHAVENPHTDAVPFFPLLMAITIERERGSGRLGRDKMIAYVQAAEPS